MESPRTYVCWNFSMRFQPNSMTILAVAVTFLGLALGACRHPGLQSDVKSEEGLTAVLEADGFQYTGRNRQGFDCYVLEAPCEIEFILVPKCAVPMTTFEGEQVSLHLDPFLIASSELTCREFAMLTGKGLHDVLDQCEYEPSILDATGGTLPMRNVGFFESMRMAHTAGLELPSVAQWQLAAFGPRGVEGQWTGGVQSGGIYEGARLGWCGASDIFGVMAERCSDSGTLMAWEYPEGKGAQMKFVAIFGEGPSYCAVAGGIFLNHQASKSVANSSRENLAPKKHIGIRLALTLSRGRVPLALQR